MSSLKIKQSIKAEKELPLNDDEEEIIVPELYEIEEFEKKLTNENKICFKLIMEQLELLCEVLPRFNIPKSNINYDFFLTTVNPTVYYSGLIFSVRFI